MSFFQTKTFKDRMAQRDKHKMNRTLGVVDLTFLGIGGIIGAGVFVLTGIAAARYAGPGVALSFAAAGFLCILVGLAYGELASMIPASGSAYAYTFASLGEGMAFFCGWSLLLAYTVTASAVAVGFSSYFSSLLDSVGLGLPHALTATLAEGGVVNLPAMVIILLLSLILIRGTKESSTLNTLLIIITLLAVVGFIVLSFPHAHWQNLHPFLPYGVSGIASGAAIVFFSFMGFDTVATSAEECKKPERDLPIGIVVSIFVCMLIYISVSTALTATIPYTDLDRGDPVAYALRAIGQDGMAGFITLGILAGLVTTLIVYIFGQSRIFFAVSRDGLLPSAICKLHPKYKTPYLTTIIGSIIIAAIAGLVPLMYIVELANTGTLIVFLVNFIGLMAMRRRYPEIKRKFRFPCIYVLAPLGILVCLYLIGALSWMTNLIFLLWTLAGFAFYYLYGVKHRCWQAVQTTEHKAEKLSESSTVE